MFKLTEQMKESQEIREVGRLCYERGYICGTEGNFSIRLDENRILTTATGTCKGRLSMEDLVVTDMEGNPLPKSKGGNPQEAGPEARPSTELKMHLVVYNKRPDARAVVHAHPTTAVAFTVAGLSLDQCVLPEVVCTLGSIPTAPYATPSTDEIPDSIADIVEDHDALVLDHHGALTIGKDIWDAYYKLETVEHYAQTLMAAEILGGARRLKSSQVEKLLAICSVYGLKKPANEKKLLSSRCSDPD